MDIGFVPTRGIFWVTFVWTTMCIIFQYIFIIGIKLLKFLFVYLFVCICACTSVFMSTCVYMCPGIYTYPYLLRQEEGIGGPLYFSIYSIQADSHPDSWFFSSCFITDLLLWVNLWTCNFFSISMCDIILRIFWKYLQVKQSSWSNKRKSKLKNNNEGLKLFFNT